MKRTPLLRIGGALALLVVAVANPEAKSAQGSEAVAGAARVESAGADGGLPTRTADVQSAEYDASQRPAERPPTHTTTRLQLIAVLGAGALAIAVFFQMRRRRA